MGEIQDKNVYFSEGDKYYNEEKYEEAINSYNKYIDLLKDCGELYARRGNCYCALKEYNKAIKDYDKSIEIDGNNKYLYDYIGNCYYNLGQYAKAINDYNKAIEMDGDNEYFYFHRGNCYCALKKYNEAINDYSKAIEINRTVDYFYDNRGNCYYALRKYEEAIKDLDSAINIDGNNAEFHNKRGNCYYSLQRYEDSINNYNKAIEKDSENAVYYSNRGGSYYMLKKYKEAIRDYNRAISIDKESSYFYNSIGNSYYALGKFKEAIKYYERAIKIDENNAFLYANRGNTYRDLELYEDALKDYDKAISIDKNNAYFYTARGNSYGALGMFKDALKDYNKAIDIYDEEISFYQGRDKIYEKNKDKYSKELEEDEMIIKNLEVKEYDEIFFRYLKGQVNDIKKRSMLSTLYLAVHNLKEKMIFKNEAKNQVAHYTKLGNLKFLIKPKNLIKEDKEIPYLRLNNVSYMNDPTEGEVFLKILEESSNNKEKKLLESLYKGEIQASNGREIFNGKNHTFLTSFSKAIDTSLPMWVQYCEDGQGCCLVFNSNFFDKEDKNPLGITKETIFQQPKENGTSGIDETYFNNKMQVKEKQYYCLYEVKYVKSSDNKYVFNEDDKVIEELIKKIRKQVINCLKNANDDKVDVKSIIRDILDQVRYLFKDENYAHEKEVRIIKFENNGNVKYTGDAEGYILPHVYINMERPLEVEEVILGPKVINAMEAANYLAYSGIKTVSKSKIKYK